jgi:Xaa-Pro aminopeptidase
MISKDTYIQRRKRLKKEVGDGIIVLLGNENSSMNFRDNWYHFTQDSTFMYFCAVSLDGLAAIFDCESGVETIYGNEPSIEDIVWTGAKPSLSELAANSGISETAPTNKIEQTIHEALSSGRKVHILPPYRPEHIIKLASWLQCSNSDVSLRVSESLIKAVVVQRNIKTDEEIILINEAVNLTADMHIAAMKYAKAGMRESEVAAKVNQVALTQQAELSFPTILTKNGQTLHTYYHGNILNEGDMVLCDAGAQMPSGYSGDMTRTFPVGKKFTTKQRELYQVVLNAHCEASAALKPGISFKDIHLLACQKLAEGLTEIGLMKGNPNEAVAAGAHTMFFQCGVGHMMGMDVHDMENLGEQYVGYPEGVNKSTEFGLKSLRLGATLEAGFVVTVEPGIYIIPELIDLWQAENKYTDFINFDMLAEYRSFGGIRIEEDFVITQKGATLLGKEVPKTIEEVEAVRA